MTTPINSHTLATFPAHMNFVLMPPNTLYEIQNDAAEFKKKCETLKMENKLLRHRISIAEAECIELKNRISNLEHRLSAKEKKQEENKTYTENNNVA